MNTLKSNVEIRTAIFEDITTIQEIAQQTWPSTYGRIITKAQIEYMLELMYSNETLEKQWFHGHSFLMAEVADKPVGYASFRVIEGKVYKLDKLYVLPEAQKLGVGKKLLQEVIARIVAVGGRELQLQVNRKNKAVSFYEKMGFEILRQEDFHFGDGYFMNDYVMSIVL